MKFGKYLEILGEKSLKFGKKWQLRKIVSLENCENLGKIRKNLISQQKIWKFLNILEILKNVGNFEKFWKFGKYLDIWKVFGNLKKY